MATKGQNIQLLRAIIRELKHVGGKKTLKDDAGYGYLMNQFRSYQVTTEKICRGKHEMEHLGHTYLCLLESVRQHEELSSAYKGKGERSIEDSANLVGLALPRNPEDK